MLNNSQRKIAKHLFWKFKILPFSEGNYCSSSKLSIELYLK